MAPVPGRAILNRVILRVYDSAQHAGSQEEYELGTISLRMLSLLRTGDATLDLACYAAFGCSFTRFRERSLARQSALAWEFAKLIPDFDPTREAYNENGSE